MKAHLKYSHLYGVLVCTCIAHLACGSDSTTSATNGAGDGSSDVNAGGAGTTPRGRAPAAEGTPAGTREAPLKTIARVGTHIPAVPEQQSPYFTK